MQKKPPKKTVPMQFMAVWAELLNQMWLWFDLLNKKERREEQKNRARLTKMHGFEFLSLISLS